MRKRGAQKATPQMGRMGAEDPPSLPGGPPTSLHVVHERAIGGRGRHLEIVAQALMGLLEQNSQPLEAVFFERIDECMHTSNLRLDVTHALGVACLRLTAALVVWSLGEVAMLARIDDRDDELLRKWHRLIFKGRAVEQQGVPSPSERGCELIHHADVHACGPLLGTLARERGLDSAELGAEARGDGYEQRGR